jgi:hypothetical protein
MHNVAVWVLGLVILCSGAAAQEEADESEEPPPRSKPAVWTSPFAAGTLTEGEYLILDRVRTTRLPRRKSGPQEELILARYQVGYDDSFALGIVSRTGDGYVCRELLRDVSGYPQVHTFTRPSRPVLMLESSDGSAGFLTLDTFQRRGNRWTWIDHREGVYQGQLRNLRESASKVRFDVIQRAAGAVNAFPRREYRERWALSNKGLYRTSRVLLRRLPYVPGPSAGPGIAHIDHDE